MHCVAAEQCSSPVVVISPLEDVVVEPKEDGLVAGKLVLYQHNRERLAAVSLELTGLILSPPRSSRRNSVIFGCAAATY